MITDWLMVIITGVYVIAIIVICVFNAKAAKAAREQAEQMKLQFIQVNRPKITVEVSLAKEISLGFEVCQSRGCNSLQFISRYK